MSGLSQLLQTGLSGLSAASEALQTVANNTSNVNTPGYNVQSVNQTELPGTARRSGVGNRRKLDPARVQPILVPARGAGQFGQPGGASRTEQRAKSRCDLSRRLGRRRWSRIGARQLFFGGEPGRPGSDERSEPPSISRSSAIARGRFPVCQRPDLGEPRQHRNSNSGGGSADQYIDPADRAIEPSNPGADHRCRRPAEQPARSTRRTGAAACSANRRQFGARREWGGECLYGWWCRSGQWRDRLSARDRPKPIWRWPAHGHLWSNRAGFDREPIGRAARRIARGARPAGQHPGFGGSACGWPRCRREHPAVAGARSQRQSGTAAVFGRRAGRLCCAIQYRQRQPDRNDHRPHQFYPRRFHRRPAPQPGSRRPTRRAGR